MEHRCPTCHKTAPSAGPTAPFCSSRCKQVDLGTWLTEGYRIPTSSPDGGEPPDAAPANVPPPDGEQ